MSLDSILLAFCFIAIAGILVLIGLLIRDSTRQERESATWLARTKFIAAAIRECPVCRAPEPQLHLTVDERKPYLDLACLLCGHRWAVSTRK